MSDNTPTIIMLHHQSLEALSSIYAIIMVPQKFKSITPSGIYSVKFALRRLTSIFATFLRYISSYPVPNRVVDSKAGSTTVSVWSAARSFRG